MMKTRRNRPGGPLLCSHQARSARLAIGAGLLWAAVPAAAQDIPNLDQLAQLVRWGGVAASILVIGGALLLMSLIDRLTARLSTRFPTWRPTVLKAQTTGRFFL
jgi:hypothetical protein